MLAASLLIGLFACSGIVHRVAASQGVVVTVSTCQDVNQCAPSTCTKNFIAAEGACIGLGSNNSIINASFATFSCLKGVQICSPTKVFFNDSTCGGTPAETLWTPCGTCLQFPPRLQTCRVANDTFNVRVQSCNDNSCESCDPFDNNGLPPQLCYAHPGVPGLFLEYDNLEACAGVLVQGFNDMYCTSPSAQTIMPGQAKCFGGLTFNCSLQ